MKEHLTPLSLTRKLISFDTINPPGQERICIEYLGKLLEDSGFKTNLYEFSKGRPSLVARLELKGNKRPICFSGHVDTVPLGATPWSSDPLGGEIQGDKVYGRGSTDMKAGLAAMVVAAKNVAQYPNGKGGITVVFTASEETGSQGAHHLAGLGDVLGEAGAIVLGEPTSNYPMIGHKGVLWLEGYTSGVTAHGSMPEQGVNAIYKAANAVTELEKYDFGVPAHPLMGKPTLNVGTISGGININSVPDRATIGIDIRTIPGQAHSDVYKGIKSCLGSEVELSRVLDLGGVMTDPDDDWIKQIFHMMEGVLGERPVPATMSGFTDVSVLKPFFGNPPTVILGPGEVTMAHKTDEFCYISKIEEAVEVYTEIARKWCEF